MQCGFRVQFFAVFLDCSIRAGKMRRTHAGTGWLRRAAGDGGGEGETGGTSLEDAF